jgi:hypothetical protein
MIPSSTASLFAIVTASADEQALTSSISLVSRTSGINPAPIP